MSSIGSLVTVATPFTDRTGGKSRPGVVVAEYLQDYLVAFLTKEIGKYRHESTSILRNLLIRIIRKPKTSICGLVGDGETFIEDGS